MATWSNFLNQFSGAGIPDESAASNNSLVERADLYRLRPLPNEDVFFSMKKIDNSRVVRQADPRARARDWKVAGGAGIAATCVIGLLLPSAWSLMAGYQLSHLQQQNQQLQTERARLALEEAKLVSAERLQVLAEQQQFVDPAPDRTVYLPGKTDESLALNRR